MQPAGKAYTMFQFAVSPSTCNFAENYVCLPFFTMGRLDVGAPVHWMNSSYCSYAVGWFWWIWWIFKGDCYNNMDTAW